MRSIKTIANDLINIAAELEQYEANLRQQLFGLVGGEPEIPAIPKGREIAHGKHPPNQQYDARGRRKPITPERPRFNRTQKDQIRLLHKQGRSFEELASIYNTDIRHLKIICQKKDPEKVRLQLAKARRAKTQK